MTSGTNGNDGARNAAIDVAKGLGIFFVVLGHNRLGWNDDALFRVLFSFHMPLFFFLSGLFIDETVQPGRFFAARAQSLLKPFFVVLALIGLAKIATGSAHALPYFEGLAWANGVTLAWGPLWFLPHLFLAQAVAYGWLRAVRGWRHADGATALAATLLAAAGIHFIGHFWRIDPSDLLGLAPVTLSSGHLRGLPWGLDLVGISAACVLGGRLSARSVKAARLPVVATVAAVIALGLLHAAFRGTIDLNLRRIDAPVVATLEAVLGIVATLGLAAWLGRIASARTLLAWLGRGSIFILLFHYVLQQRVFDLLAKRNDLVAVDALVSLAAGLLVPMALWEISRRSRVLSMLLLPKPASRPPTPIEPAVAAV